MIYYILVHFKFFTKVNFMELLNSLKGYKSKFLINDILSGLLVAIIAMPLSIALGIQSVPSGVGNGIQMV